jgi:hypothetical protein
MSDAKERNDNGGMTYAPSIAKPACAGIRSVVLSASEQRALAWLLRASDNGAIISGAELPNIMRLKHLGARLMRLRDSRKAQQ